MCHSLQTAGSAKTAVQFWSTLDGYGLFVVKEALRVFVLDPFLSDLWDGNCEYIFAPLVVCPAVGQWQPEEDDLLSRKLSVSVDFESVRRKDLYLLVVKIINLRSPEGLKASRWTVFFGAGSSLGAVGGPCTILLLINGQETSSGGLYMGPSLQTGI